MRESMLAAGKQATAPEAVLSDKRKSEIRKQKAEMKPAKKEGVADELGAGEFTTVEN